MIMFNCKFCNHRHGTNHHALFRYSQPDARFIFITDMCRPYYKTVTNDIEYVLWSIKDVMQYTQQIIPPDIFVIYKDSRGTIDEVFVDASFGFRRFRSLAINGKATKDLETAIKHCLFLHEKEVKIIACK